MKTRFAASTRHFSGRPCGALIAGWLGLAILANAEALATPPSLSMRVAQGRKLYDALEYEAALRTMAPVTQSPDATITEKVEALEVLGLSYLVLGDATRAKAAFKQLLTLDPSRELDDPSGSPKLRQFFEAVKEVVVPGYRADQYVVLLHNAPPRGTAGTPFELAVTQGSGATGSRLQVLIHFRRRGDLVYHIQPLVPESARRFSVRVLLPAAHERYAFEYCFEGRTPNGTVVSRIGTQARPIVLDVRGTPDAGSTAGSSSVWRSWWLWSAVGVAVVGGVTAAVVLSSGHKAPQGTLEPSVQLPLTSPSGW